MAPPQKDTFEYVTYTKKRETCPACLKPIRLDRPARREMLGRADGDPIVAYWHMACAPEGARR
ncbi:hypothetical protein [Streptomyces sp. NPDC090445]|uniref:hypothetical protein n=1 Tax=Streptomyces sp. NPDC090445 TaxID=3365963 RepID=UPI00382BB814